ncbi:MAG TPA: efflux RND transporter periplasmic adaptor subunit [Gammaproteobacteria bacterium]
MASRSVFLALAAVLVTGLAACGKGEAEAVAEEKQEEQVAVPVEVAAAYSGAVSAFYTGTTTLEAERDAEVVAKVGGVVRELFVEAGDRVEAGEIMAKLDDDRLRLEVARAEANVAKLEQEYRRNRQLHEAQLVSAEAYQRLGFELEVMRAELGLAKLQLDHTEIRAPFDGVVAARHIKVGNMIEQNAPVFRVTTYEPLIARLHVPERELNKLAVGQAAALRVDALPGQDFEGIVDRVSPVVDANTGTFAVFVALEDTGGKLKPGMFGRLDIVYDVHADAVLVPRAAVVIEDAKSAVFVIRDGHAQRQAVTTGYANNGSVEILDGIQPGDQVVTVGQNSLKDGAPVAVINAKTEPEEVLAQARETAVAETPAAAAH